MRLFKINRRGAIWLMLLGAVTGSMAVTNASAMSKGTKKTLTMLKKRENKKTATSRQIDAALDQVGVKNLSALMQDDNNGELPTDLPAALSTHKLTRAIKISVGGKKSVTLPKGSVVLGSKYTLNPDFPSRFGIAIENLSKKNQKRVFKSLSKVQPSAYFVLEGKNQTAVGPYTKKTAFSYRGVQNLPDLQSKNLQSYYDGDRTGNPFLTVTADNYLNDYTNYQSKSGKVNYSKYSQSVKIKKLKRGKTNFTYYLAKPMKGFGAKKVRVGKAYQYKLKVSLGHVFRSYDNYNLDPGGYRITVKVGKKSFYVNLGNIAETYIGNAKNDQYVENAVKPADAQKYIANLQ